SCGHRFYEVMSAVLGPLLLDQLPKSKPFTPMFSCPVSPWRPHRPQAFTSFTLPSQHRSANCDSPLVTPGWLRSVRTCRPLSSTPSDTELVPLWVGEHHPPGPVIPAPVV